MSRWWFLFLISGLRVEGSPPVEARTPCLESTSAFVVSPGRAQIRGRQLTQVYQRRDLPLHRDAAIPLSDPQKIYVRSLARIAQEIDRQWPGRRAAVRSVFYPMAGSDAGSVFRLFPHCETLVVVDSNPLFIPERAAVTYARQFRGAHLHYTQEDGSRVRYRARLFGALEFALGGRLRIHHATAFTTQEPQVAFNTAIDGYELVESGPGRHTVLDFDTGPGTLRRRYVHLQLEVVDSPEKTRWWREEIEALGVNAVLVKAAGRSLLPTLDAKEEKREPKPLGAAIAGWLKENHGLLVEGWESERDGWELSGLEPPPKGTQTLLIDPADLRFGYDYRAHVLAW